MTLIISSLCPSRSDSDREKCEFSNAVIGNLGLRRLHCLSRETDFAEEEKWSGRSFASALYRGTPQMFFPVSNKLIPACPDCGPGSPTQITRNRAVFQPRFTSITSPGQVR
jgi:hypothetical protein